jgi:hypothetical protein
MIETVKEDKLKDIITELEIVLKKGHGKVEITVFEGRITDITTVLKKRYGK